MSLVCKACERIAYEAFINAKYVRKGIQVFPGTDQLPHTCVQPKTPVQQPAPRVGSCLLER